MSRDRRALNLTILITAIVIVIVVAVAIIAVNASTGNWGVYEILSAIGGAFLIVGGVGVWTSYAGGIGVSSIRLHAQAPEVAKVEMDYARKRRAKMPWISFIIIAIGLVFLAVGLSGIW
ncbi:MAG: hypothetical protein FK732_03365 [Asgard group archaeon]|nr:hypothetical protein [Asgard group archaeon]